MKTMTRPSATLTEDQARQVLREIAVALMDHGAVRLESGTLESAAIIALMKRD